VNGLPIRRSSTRHRCAPAPGAAWPSTWSSTGYRENRSQFVITTLKGGREGIFWQTAKTTRKTRPGVRLPTRRSAAGELEIVVDSRERYAWKFERQQASTARRALVVGDYAVEADGEVVGVVERKKLAELAGNVVDDSRLVTLGKLATAPRAAIVVEDRWADVFRLTYVAPSMVAEMLTAAQVRYPNVPIVFCENRQLAGPAAPRRRPAGPRQRERRRHRRRSWRCPVRSGSQHRRPRPRRRRRRSLPSHP
jgi:hypothetical protein